MARAGEVGRSRCGDCLYCQLRPRIRQSRISWVPWSGYVRCRPPAFSAADVNAFTKPAADGSGSSSALADKGAVMLPGLRVAHRLLLISVPRLTTVYYFAYTLVHEKNITIHFTRKERHGISYADVVRQS